jgi:hypothetical protein
MDAIDKKQEVKMPAPKEEKPQAAPAPKTEVRTGKFVTIQTGHVMTGAGEDRRPVPTLVKVYAESDMKKKLYLAGPVKLKDGSNSYVTVDGKKLRFDASTGALL